MPNNPATLLYHKMITHDILYVSTAEPILINDYNYVKGNNDTVEPLTQSQ